MNLNKPTWALPIALLGSFLGWHLLCAGFEIASARRETREQATRDIADASFVASRAFGHWMVEQETKRMQDEVVCELTLAALGHTSVAEVAACLPPHDVAPYTVAWLDDAPTVTSSVAGVWEAVGHFHDLNAASRVYRVTVVRGGNGLEAADVQLLTAEAPDGQKDTGQ
jgi:hypothetical protein